MFLAIVSASFPPSPSFDSIDFVGAGNRKSLRIDLVQQRFRAVGKEEPSDLHDLLPAGVDSSSADSVICC